MMIRQGEVYWIHLDEPVGSEPGFRHPHVVVQSDLVTRSLIRTVLVCPLTSNLTRAKAPGNVLLQKGEAGLGKRSVVNVSQVFPMEKSALEERIGSVSRNRIREIVAGIRLMIEPRDVE